MKKVVLILVMCTLSLVGAVHAMPVSDTNPALGPNGMTGVIQKATLPGYKTMTIGEAFGKYRFLEKKEWRETRAANGNIFIDFIGYVPTSWFDFKMKKAGISARGLEVKFVIHPDGAYELGMVSSVKVMTDGKIYRTPSVDVKNILDAIYANQRLKL